MPRTVARVLFFVASFHQLNTTTHTTINITTHITTTTYIAIDITTTEIKVVKPRTIAKAFVVWLVFIWFWFLQFILNIFYIQFANIC